jgi:hypothetical protein
MSFSKIHFWEDRFFQGFVAGSIGWVAQAAFVIPLHALHISKFAFFHYAAALGWGKGLQGILTTLFAELIVFAMQGTFGSLFALLTKGISRKIM